ncbi:hypothetical protein AHiyo1_11210 [Arthrobacter sp. Hiyo1]|nr:hypothetical protein AHiyo1_11210 [Arthrobacter sp. Hiyo1]
MPCRLFDPGSGGCGKTQSGVLVPCGNHPVRSHACRHRAADDPTEETPRLHGHEPGLCMFGKEINDRGRVQSAGRQRSTEDCRDVVSRGAWPYRPPGQGPQPLTRMLPCTFQCLLIVAGIDPHECMLRPGLPCGHRLRRPGRYVAK